MTAIPRFGLAIPTATEGMMYPVPFASVNEVVDLSVAAERLGFDSVWGNDHVSTQRYVRSDYDDPPRFYDPLTLLGFVAACTTTIRLATAVLVLPFRHPVIVAKQAATLDQLSDGRFMLGVGVGAYREEFDAMYSGRELHRGRYVDEFLDSLAVLFSHRRATYEGEFIRFVDVESFPKPVQDPLPILSGGNSPQSRRRAATTANGWLPACLTPREYADGLRDIRRIESEQDIDPSRHFDAGLQLVVSIHDRHEDAVERFRSSRVHSHLASLTRSTMKGRLGDPLEARNLVGTLDDVLEQIQAYVDAGLDVFAGLLFATDTVDETLEAMERFSHEVIAALTDRSVS